MCAILPMQGRRPTLRKTPNDKPGRDRKATTGCCHADEGARRARYHSVPTAAPAPASAPSVPFWSVESVESVPPTEVVSAGPRDGLELQEVSRTASAKNDRFSFNFSLIDNENILTFKLFLYFI